MHNHFQEQEGIHLIDYLMHYKPPPKGRLARIVYFLSDPFPYEQQGSYGKFYEQIRQNVRDHLQECFYCRGQYREAVTLHANRWASQNREGPRKPLAEFDPLDILEEAV